MRGRRTEKEYLLVGTQRRKTEGRVPGRYGHASTTAKFQSVFSRVLLYGVIDQRRQPPWFLLCIIYNLPLKARSAILYMYSLRPNLSPLQLSSRASGCSITTLLWYPLQPIGTSLCYPLQPFLQPLFYFPCVILSSLHFQTVLPH